MSTPPSIPNLHDATLFRVIVEWKAGVGELELDPVRGGQLLIRARGLRELNLPRRQDWGPSVSVNEATVSVGDAGEIRLQIQMQSGDEIVVVCEELDVEELGHDPYEPAAP
jgi:hypothetical protein